MILVRAILPSFPFWEGLGTTPDKDVGSLQQLVEEGSHLRLVGGTHVLVDELAVLEEEERRDVAHGILLTSSLFCAIT